MFPHLNAARIAIWLSVALVAALLIKAIQLGTG